MMKRQLRQYEMFVRIGTFAAAHREQFPEGSAGSKGFAVVAAAVDRIRAASMSKLTIKQEGRKARAAAKQVVIARIRAIAKTAQLIAKTAPGADSRFQQPARYSDVAVTTAAHAFLTEVEPVKAAFILHGLPETFMQELRQSTEAFEQGMSERSVGKTTVSGAQGIIRAAFAQGMDAARDLDVIVANTLGYDGLTLDEWRRARHIESGGRRASVGAPAASLRAVEMAVVPEASAPATLPLEKAS